MERKLGNKKKVLPIFIDQQKHSVRHIYNSLKYPSSIIDHHNRVRLKVMTHVYTLFILPSYKYSHNYFLLDNSVHPLRFSLNTYYTILNNKVHFAQIILRYLRPGLSRGIWRPCAVLWMGP